MKRVALEKAAGHLELACLAIEDMDRASDFKTYEQRWVEFLAQASRFYSKLEQGVKGCPKSEPWFGRRKHERRKDPLLCYIHHARNSEEHTIEHTTSMAADALTGKAPDGDFEISFDFMVDKNGRQHFRNIRYKDATGADLPFTLVNAELVLLTAYDRQHGDKFDPPKMHRARPIVDTTPRGVAMLALAYLREMLDEASGLPERF